MAFSVQSPEGNSFCLPIKSLFFILYFETMIDEEINVLLIGMLCLRNLEVHTSDVVKASVIPIFRNRSTIFYQAICAG